MYNQYDARLDPEDVVQSMKQVGMEDNAIGIVKDMIETLKWAAEMFRWHDFPNSARACLASAEQAEGEDNEP